MTRRDFELIARVFAAQAPHDDSARRLIEALADELATTNPRFDRIRFVRACRIQE